jgi:hypothetical protein
MTHPRTAVLKKDPRCTGVYNGGRRRLVLGEPKSYYYPRSVRCPFSKQCGLFSRPMKFFQTHQEHLAIATRAT